MKARLSILIYHRVLPRPDPLLPGVPCVRQFDRQIALLKRCFCVLPLARAVQLLREDALPQHAACITFDDGYADNAELALPILKRHGLTACFFIATAYLDGGQMWNDDVICHVRSLPGRTQEERVRMIASILDELKYQPFTARQALAAKLAPSRQVDLMMRSSQIVELHRAGMEIGAHTDSHPILSTMNDDQAYSDIHRGKLALEKIISAPVSLFAYPNGKPGTDYHQRHVDMVRYAGFEAAVSTMPGAATARDDLFQLPRFTPWERDRPRFLLRLLQNLYWP